MLNSKKNISGMSTGLVNVSKSQQSCQKISQSWFIGRSKTSLKASAKRIAS